MSLSVRQSLEIPRRVEIVARTSTNRRGGAKLGLQSIGAPFGLEGHLGNRVELQGAYVLEVGGKSSFSKALDAMENEKQTALLPGRREPSTIRPVIGAETS